MRQRHSAFTLIEVLVVVGIIALLLGILVPVLGSTRAAAIGTQCRSNLRQLYVVQSLYHQDFGRFTPPAIFSDPFARTWPVLLAPYVAPSLKGRDFDSDAEYRAMIWLGREPLSLMVCPGAAPEQVGEGKFSYGLNPFTQMPGWAGRNDRKGDMTKLILMADKGVARENDHDTLKTEDGFAFYYASPLLRWLYTYPQHTNAGAFRHSGKPVDPAWFASDRFAETYNPAGLNAVMADGHVETLTRRDLLLSSGRWYFAPVNHLPIVEFPGPCCQ